MTRSLLLMRHAKSDWNDAHLHDKDRTLNARGQASAPLMAEWLISNNLLPDIVICSSAVRTQQTLKLMLACWSTQDRLNAGIVLPEVMIEDQLYLATDNTILALASGQPKLASKQCIMMLGHNPGMETLASKMSERTIEMPTAAIAVFESNESNQTWPVAWHESKMWKWRGIVKPKELDS